MLGGEAGGLGAGGGAYLVVDGSHVGVYGAGAYVEFLGYPGVGEASGDQPEHFDLAGAQVRGVGGLRGMRIFGGL